METVLHFLSVTLFLQLLHFFCVVFRPTSSSAAAASWPFVWPPKGRLSLLLSAGCSLAVSGTFCCFLPRNVTAFSSFCVSRQANGLPDSSPSHQHGQRLLLEVDQRLCRLGARLQAQLWRSEESLCVSATGVMRLWQCRWGKRLKNMRGGKKWLLVLIWTQEEKKKLFWFTEDGGCWVRWKKSFRTARSIHPVLEQHAVCCIWSHVNTLSERSHHCHYFFSVNDHLLMFYE